MKHRHCDRLCLIALLALVVPFVAIAQPQATPAEPAPGAGSAPLPQRASTDEEAALRVIVADGQVRVADLVARLQAEPERAEEIQQQIIQVKFDARVRFLQAKVEFARQSDDPSGLQAAQTALAALLNPPTPETVPADRERPDPMVREVR
jgi:hypothetical protein